MMLQSIFTRVSLGALLWTAACEQPMAGEVADENLDTTEEMVADAPVRVVKSAAYGESVRILYREASRLPAVQFVGRAGDQVTIDVSSNNGDAVAWLLDARFAEVASNDDVSPDNVNSHIEYKVPESTQGDAMFYVALQDYNHTSHYFTVKVDGRRLEQKIVLLTADRCASGRNRYLANGVNAGPEDLALDTFCAELLLAKKAPKGFIAMFGSSRLSDGTPEYANAREFARQWTLAHRDLPVLTGGGPGIMEAGNRGAKEAGGVSLGLSTYFKAADDKLNTFVTDGYMFTDFATRERAMLNYAKGAIIYAGGVGTAWELFMTLSQVQTKRLNPMPIVVVGQDMGNAFKGYVDWMAQKGTISPADLNLYTVVSTPEEAVAALAAAVP